MKNIINEFDIGRNIKKIRMEKGITQTQLGNMISKSESTIRKYESGSVKVTTEMLNLIANKLETPLGKFLETSPTDINDISSREKENPVDMDEFTVTNDEVKRYKHMALNKLYDEEKALLDKLLNYYNKTYCNGLYELNNIDNDIYVDFRHMIYVNMKTLLKNYQK